MAYESPINIVLGSMHTQLDGEIMRAVQEVGVSVDEEELIRALEYDREQYWRGYQDAKDEIVRCQNCGWWHRFKSPCARSGVCDKYAFTKSEDGYCDSAERRTE